jgi:hypothetical protein
VQPRKRRRSDAGLGEHPRRRSPRGLGPARPARLNLTRRASTKRQSVALGRRPDSRPLCSGRGFFRYSGGFRVCLCGAHSTALVATTHRRHLVYNPRTLASHRNGSFLRQIRRRSRSARGRTVAPALGVLRNELVKAFLCQLERGSGRAISASSSVRSSGMSFSLDDR